MHSNTAACRFLRFYTTTAPCGHIFTGRRPAARSYQFVIGSASEVDTKTGTNKNMILDSAEQGLVGVITGAMPLHLDYVH